jgi:hypothetical protein
MNSDIRQLAKKPRTTLDDARENKLGRSYCAYLVFAGASIARRLKVSRVSVLELGVAGGAGLLALERYADAAREELGVQVDVYGFDTGEGMPSARDYRDMPYFFKEGNYRMDKDKLNSSLASAQLILGDVVETFPQFLNESPAPIAAISFDMDHYHPTMETLKRIGLGDRLHCFMPRPLLYFDNTVGDHIKAYNEFSGELLAIDDFNASHSNAKIARCRDVLRVPRNCDWYHKMFFLHIFSHPMYNSYIGRHGPGSLALK